MKKAACNKNKNQLFLRYFAGLTIYFGKSCDHKYWHLSFYHLRCNFEVIDDFLLENFGFYKLITLKVKYSVWFCLEALEYSNGNIFRPSTNNDDMATSGIFSSTTVNLPLKVSVGQKITGENQHGNSARCTSIVAEVGHDNDEWSKLQT